jgi:hypothetical protein
MNKTIFLDTNIFLHYRAFDEIDWLSIFNCEAVTILIPPITIYELNKQKELHPQKHIRERASKTLKKLNGLFAINNPITLSQGKDIFLEDRDPHLHFTELGLHKEIQDDNLIASILYFRSEHPDSNLNLVTSDGGLLLVSKAKRYNIPTLSLSDDLRLPNEFDPQQKRIKDLEEQILQLKAIAPDLSVSFDDGNNFFSYTVSPPIAKKPDQFAAHMQDIIHQYPKLNKSLPPNRNNLGTLSAQLNQMFELMRIPDKEVDEYNKELDKFYHSYEIFLEADSQYLNMSRRTIKLELFLSNDGTFPGEDIDVFLHFPNGFELKGKKDYPSEPKPPKPPEKPTSSILRALQPPYIADLMTPHNLMIPKVAPPPGNVSPPRIRTSKSYDVEFHVTRLKHGMRESFQSLLIIFDSFESANSFEVECKIHAANLPQPVNHKLHVVINKENDVT